VPSAASCSVVPAASDVAEFALVTLMETSVLVVSVFCEFDLLLPPPQPERTRQTIKTELINAPIFFIKTNLFLNALHRVSSRASHRAKLDNPGLESLSLAAGAC
jgi:hypothetical protein